MKLKKSCKLLGLAAVAAVTLSLSACYVAQDQVTDDSGLSLNNNNIPWQTIAPYTAAPDPTAAPMVVTA